MSSTLDEPVLTVRGLSKTFTGTRALIEADLEITRGEIHALVGENGSGKSTLVKILAGYHRPDPGGTVTVAGAPLDLNDPAAPAAAGLRFVHQDLGLVGMLDSVDNMALGHGYPTGRARRVRWGEAEKASKAGIEELGYDIDVRRRMETLAIAERTAVAIARALSGRRSAARVLVLDEPTANFPVSDVERLFALLRRIRDSGVSILFISHHFNEVFALADRVTVLRDGRIVATRPVHELDQDRLIEIMIGRRLETVERPGRRVREAPDVLRLHNLSGRTVGGLELAVSAGEIVGVAGVTGSGREELAPLVIGGASRDGVVEVNGKTLPSQRPDLAVAAGMAYVPAERQANGVLHEHNVRENVTIGRLSPYRIGGLVRMSRERSDVARLLETFQVRPREPEAPISSLSGGNQQKVMLARALRLEPRVLILDEPTQGVDVGAQAEIHRLLREAASRGLAVLVCSSSSEELAQLADRVVVVHEGRVVGEQSAPLDPDEITAMVLMTPEAVA